MKVILLRDVAKIGRRNQIVEVPDGYAQNQLIPKKWAQPATPANLKKITHLNETTKAHDDAEQVRFEAAVKSIQAQPLVIEGQANDQGHLFKAIHESDIVVAASARGITLDKRYLEIPTQIKSVGAHTILCKRGGKTLECSIEIISKK
jgi:large subunit ribosomal protein L9